jgi:hypothetical protein
MLAIPGWIISAAAKKRYPKRRTTDYHIGISPLLKHQQMTLMRPVIAFLTKLSQETRFHKVFIQC